MQLAVFCVGLVLVSLSDGAAKSPKDGKPPSNECKPDEVFCPRTSTCVARLEFSCGNKSCGKNKQLCGSPKDMHCISADKKCPRNDQKKPKNDSLPSHPEDADDDNPYSRDASDGEYDFDRNGTISDMNDTSLRRRLHAHFDYGGIDWIADNIGQRGGHANRSFGNKDRQHRDACDRRYSPCVRNALAKLMFLSDLDGECCKMAQEPQKFAQRLRNISRRFSPRRADCPRGTRFCPFSFVLKGKGCIPVRGNVSVGHKNRSDDGTPNDDHWTLWGDKSRKEYRICDILKRSFSNGKPCSYRHLVQFLRAKNDSISPVGKPCPKGKKFCPSSFDCRSKEKECRFEKATRWASKNLCNSSQHLCLGCGIECRLKDERCPREANMSKALRHAALTLDPENITNEAFRMLSKSGWASFCFLRKALATCILERLKECLSREAHCRDTGYESHKKCLSSENFCQKITEVARPFSTENHRLCKLLRTDATEFEKKIKSLGNRKPWGGKCPERGVFCPTTMECEHDLSNCTTDRQFFQRGLAQPWKMNHKQEADTKFCSLTMSSVPEGCCSFRKWLTWQARKNKTCSPCGRCCPEGQKFSLAAMKCLNPQDKDKMKLELNHTKCDSNDHVFCARQHVCLPKHVNCTDPVRFDYLSTSSFANKSGWAAFCQVRDFFTARLEYGYSKCQQLFSQSNGTCRAQITCSDKEQFCRRVGRCVPRGNCSRRPRPPDHGKPKLNNSQCNLSNTEVLMLWSKEPLKSMFPKNRVPDFVGLLEVSDEFGADLLFSSADDDWKPYKGPKGCGANRMRVVSTNSALRLASCAHGFLPFEIESAPDNSVHGQCVNIPDSNRPRDTVVMVMLPNCAAGLHIAVNRADMTLREDHPSKKELLSSYVSVKSQPSQNCSVLELEESLTCRVSRKFVSRYNLAVKRLENKVLGVVITKIDRKVQLKCFTPRSNRPVVVLPRDFIPLNTTCFVQPAKNVFGNGTITFAAACRLCKGPAPVHSDAERPKWLQKISPKDYISLLLKIKKGQIDDVIKEIVGRLNAERDEKLKRKIINLVRSFIEFHKKETCVGPPNCECRPGKERVQLDARITPVNDPPTFGFERGAERRIPIIFPENDSDLAVEKKCVKVGMLTKMSLEFIKNTKRNKAIKNITAAMSLSNRDGIRQPVARDPDNSEIGIAVIMAPTTKYGKWMYKIKGEALQEMKNTPGMVLLLKPHDCIYFRANKDDSWSKFTADFMSIKGRLWDGSDDLLQGYHALNDSLMDDQTSFSREEAKFLPLKLGCDNKPGSIKKRDKCGKCLIRGVKKDECLKLGCDGVPNSKREEDECGNCELPGSKQKYCSGYCDEPSYIKQTECGPVCQSNGSKPVKLKKDCNNDCFGNATLSKCNASVCVGGKTGRPINWGRDQCGVCGGTNKCVDCEGKVRGKKMWDSCGVCLYPNDKRFDSCPEILNVNTRAVPGDEPSVISLQAVGIQRSINCSFKGDNGRKYPLEFKRFQGGSSSKKPKPRKSSEVSLQTPPGMVPGKYSLHCFFDDGSTEITFKDKFLVYNQPSISNVSPNEIEVDTETNVTITGTGFVNSPTLTCITDVTEKGRRKVRLKALFVNATTIICVVRRCPWAKNGTISVLFGPGAVNEKLASTMKKNFYCYNRVPQPSKCEFSRSRRFIFIYFKRQVDCEHTGKRDCKPFIKGSALNKLKGSTCNCKNRLTIRLRDSKFRLGDEIKLDLSNFKRKFSVYTKHFPSEEKTLACNINDTSKVKFTVGLSTPLKVGSCGSFVVSARTNMDAAISWSVTIVNSPAVTAGDIADVQNLNNTLTNLPSNRSRIWLSNREIKAGFYYNITMCARADFNGEEGCVTKTVGRVTKNVPTFKFARSIIKIRPSVTLRLPVIDLRSSSCGKRGRRSLWSCDDPSLEFDDDNPLLIITRDQWTANRTYTCILRQSSIFDAALFSEEKVIIVVQTEVMRAKIKGGGRRTVSVQEEVVCDGRDSKDPNNFPEKPYFQWKIKCKEDADWDPLSYLNKTTGKYERLILPPAEMVAIPAGILPAGKICKMTLTYFKKDMHTSASVYLDVKAQEPPAKVKIIATYVKDFKVVFKAVVFSRNPDLHLEWSCQKKDEQGDLIEIDLEDLSLTQRIVPWKKPDNRPFGREKVILVLKKFSEGLKLKCTLTASRGEESAFAEEDIEVNEPPREGTCKIEKSEEGRISLTADGFEDPNGDLLSYRCGFIDETGERVKYRAITSWSESNTCDVDYLSLPTGEVKCFVQAKDQHRAKIRSDCGIVHIPSREFNKEEIANLTDVLVDQVNQNDFSECLAMVKSIIKDSNETDEIKHAKTNMFNDVLEKIIINSKDTLEDEDKPRDAEDEATTNEITAAALGGLKKRNKTVGNAKELSQTVRGLSSPKKLKQRDGNVRRKRRAADDGNGEDEGVVVVEKTPDQVETILDIYHKLIDPKDFSIASMAVKSDFIAVVDELGRSMCQSVNTGEQAVIAKSDIVVIRSDKNNFDNINVNFTLVACENCDSFVQASAQVLLGQALKDRYQSWDCDEDGCNGACIVSAQFPYDLLAASDNGSLISDVVYVKLFNPETAAHLSVSSLAEPATFRIPLRNYSVSNDTAPVCHAWNELSQSWTTDDVTTGLISENENGDLVVECQYTKLGFIAAFAVNSSLLPPQTSTSQPPTVSTQHVIPDEPVYIRFKLDANFSDHISSESKKAIFITDITKSIADKLAVDKSRIADVDVRPGSILVTFKLLPGGPGENNASTAISTLRDLVTNGNFTVTLGDGQTLVADPVSFLTSATAWTIASTPQSATPTGAPTTQEEQIETTSDLSTGALVGLIVGSVLGVVLLIICVILFFNMRGRHGKVENNASKNSEIKLMHSPPQAFAHDNKGVQQESLKEDDQSNQYPMVEIREEASTPLPGTPLYPEENGGDE